MAEVAAKRGGIDNTVEVGIAEAVLGQLKQGMAGAWLAERIEMGKEVPDDVVHLFAAVGRHDQIVKAIEERFGGLTDALNARANAAQLGPLPRELIQDIRQVPHAFRRFKLADT